MKLTIKDVQWHRNGVCGVGFYAVTFDDTDNGPMVATMFDEPGYCAVYQLDKLAQGNVRFGENSWRGDCYEDILRPLVAGWKDSGRCGEFSVPAITQESAQ